MSAPRTTTGPAAVQVTTRGEVPPAMAEYAESKVAQVYHYTTEPILSARVVLTQSMDPARERPAVAEARLDYDRTQVRAQASASEMDAAIDLAAGRLQRAVVHHQRREQTRHRWLATPSEDEWRHGMIPTGRLDHFRRPVAERELVRRKSFALEPMTLDEAAFDMEEMDYDFYLFADLDSGRDAVVHRVAGGGYAVRGDVPAGRQSAVAVDYEGPAPVMDDQEARAHLDLAGEPFVFYLDRESGRGRVLYLRYDGHYGLITAA